jgi:branched-chain amino acid transport system substrate-binding protein
MPTASIGSVVCTPRCRITTAAGLLVLLLPLAGCGTRMSSDRIAAADGSALQGAAATPRADLAASSTDDVGTQAPAGTAATGTAGAAFTPAGAEATVTTDTRPGTNVSAGRSTATAPGGKPSVPTGPNAPCTQSLAPIVLGQAGAVSGLIGAAIGNIRSGIALWVKAVNAAGGVQCHPIQMYQMDDGADPARVTSNMTEMVRNKGAVAIVGAGVGTTFSAARRFAETNKIPIIGGDMVEPGWYGSPWVFPEGGSPLADYSGAMIGAANAVKGRRVGLIYCVEAAICGIIANNFDILTKAAGLEIGTKKIASLTAPDYTGECQAMKAANVDVLFYALDGSAQSRAARSCRALGITAPVATSAVGISEQAALDPNLRALGVYLGTNNAPFTASDTPGGKDFRDTYARIAPGSPMDQNVMFGWASGKLFEAALANVFAQARSGSVTTALILEGLWKVDQETLDGLAPPLKFNRNAAPTNADCYYLLTIRTEGYASPFGSKLTCLKGLPKGV